MKLNVGDGTRTGAWGSNTFTTTTFNTQENYSSTNGSPYIYYCWTSIKGFSKIGKYEGNNNADGTFVYCGFKPAFVLVKRTNGDNWTIMDNARNVSNPTGLRLFTNSNTAEGGTDTCDFYSNGFKLTRTDAGENNGNYVFMAFADSPYVSSAGVPTTAH